ncbi:hypothetical protein DBV05_g10678 [Lasiodiplodia theobromae]|uniref:NACHT domain-containing protein n=1 Tax=Lasiodiplodia theobromae TaxID=45133 RepID=A0A5N5CZ43_9PEZI|nr:hypothetical protein DBV05_g10678 [Lasiodiplodia theobromae]
MQPPQNARSRDQYTVGWIAALDCELTAAMSMLDEEHEQPHDFERGPNDDNVYVWGEINKHNIAIACLKAGVCGTTSAATTAMRLLSAFPNIKFGLMVGIGAGVPQRGNKPDIRLGDVVISEPGGSTGGVYLYDLVKAKSGGISEPKGFLNSPPGILLKSLTRLRAEHKLKGMDIQRHLDRITPNMAEPDDDTPGFVHQGVENDRLFKPDSLHVDGDDCENCIASEQVKRKERPRPTRPRFHYGIIASGNTLVKDGAHRDELIKRVPGGCLCLEMEAAGLMNDFPCLVVRGICDYADTHKNDQWQPYAAVTAAAYARELLHFVPREEVERAAKATEIMQEFAGQLEANHKITKDTNQRVKQAEIKRWLSPVDPESNWATARSQYYSNTGQWFLERDEFSNWKKHPGSFLWLHGRPGCGKTILSSTIIDHLRRVEPPSKSKNAVLFYYFDFKDTSKRSTSNFIRTLLMQLSTASDEAWKKLEELYDSRKGNSQSLDSDLIKAFQSISANFDHIMIVLDALDEAMESERTYLIQTIIQIISTGSENIHLIATSRSDIKSALERAKPVAVNLTRDEVKEDITRYIRARIWNSEKHPKLQQRWQSRPDVLQEIETTLRNKADGM